MKGEHKKEKIKSEESRLEEAERRAKKGDGGEHCFGDLCVEEVWAEKQGKWSGDDGERTREEGEGRRGIQVRGEGGQRMQKRKEGLEKKPKKRGEFTEDGQRDEGGRVEMEGG